ncbi:MAG TPA: sialate O-acetylesterase [Balneolales bacterium]|nr:sialate O-acetylesterase [Balneolales bacterium]
MKKTFASIILAVLVLTINLSAYAQLHLPSIESDNMVLQQNRSIQFRGWAGPIQKIQVVASWNNDTLKTVTPSDAEWSVTLKTPKAGGTYHITVIGDTTLVIHNVLIGEVWLCSGQSNMEFSPSWHPKYFKSVIEKAHHPELRFFKVDKMSAPYPQKLIQGKWQVCTPKSVRSFSAAGYFFGRELRKKLNEPVGLIESAWGGTPVEAWTPSEVFAQHTKLAVSAAKLTPVPWCPVRPSVTYNAMIHPLVKYPIAGVIWYQGEENTANPSTYEATFSDMIHSWRGLWHKQFPFYFVQIAPFAYGQPYSAALVREAQLKTWEHMPKTGMVVTTDITGDTTNIHPYDKIDVGRRLADWALTKTYGMKGISYSGPLYQSMTVKGNKTILHFKFAQNGLMKKGRGPLKDFMIAGADHHFVPAKAKIKGSTVVVYSSSVHHPVAVRFGFSNTAEPNLFNKAGLPASPFRTDHWKVGK